MADQDPTSATAGGDAIIAKQAQVKAELAAATGAESMARAGSAEKMADDLWWLIRNAAL